MEIDKVLFSQLSSKSFEDLDVNSDGKINESDIKLSKDNNIKNIISQLINSDDIDEEAEIIDINKEDTVLSDSKKTGSTKKSLEEFKKSITMGARWPSSNADKLVNDKGYNNGTTFVVYSCVSVSIEHCGYQMAGHYENFKNNFSNILETMYDLSDQANFIYQPTTAMGRDRCGLDNGPHTDINKPCIIKYVDGVAKDVIWLDTKDCSAVGFRNLITSNIEGYKENNSNVNNQENNNQEITDVTTVNSKNKPEEAQQLLDTSTKEYLLSQAEYLQITINMEENELVDLESQIEDKETELRIKQNLVEEKSKEYQKIQEELENAQEQDASKISKLSSLAEEINILNLSIANLLDDIKAVNSKLISKQNLINTHKNALQNLNDRIDKIVETKEIPEEKKDEPPKEDTPIQPIQPTPAIDNENIDWTALKVEGKGINIYNLFKLFHNEKNPYSNRPINFGSASDFLAKYNALSDEEKAVVDIFYDKEETKGNNIGTQNRKRLELLFQYDFNNMTRWDRDGDGFLSDDDIQEIKILAENGSNKNWNVSINDRVSNAFLDAHSTTINGKKVYIAGNCVVTEDEIDVFKNALNSSGNVDGVNAMNKVMEELGGKTTVTDNGPCECCPNGYTSYGFEYTNSVGIKSYLGINHNTMALNKQVKNILALAEK